MECPQEGLSGAQIARATKLASGTLYPILARLEVDLRLRDFGTLITLFQHPARHNLRNPARSRLRHWIDA